MTFLPYKIFEATDPLLELAYSTRQFLVGSRDNFNSNDSWSDLNNWIQFEQYALPDI